MWRRNKSRKIGRLNLCKWKKLLIEQENMRVSGRSGEGRVGGQRRKLIYAFMLSTILQSGFPLFISSALISNGRVGNLVNVNGERAEKNWKWSQFRWKRAEQTSTHELKMEIILFAKSHNMHKNVWFLSPTCMHVHTYTHDNLNKD